MLLYQVRLKDESFYFAVNYDEFKISYLFNKLPGLVVEISAGLKIRSDAIAEVLSLSDVENFSRRVFVQVDACRIRQSSELFFDRHNHDFNLVTFKWIKARKPLLRQPGLWVWAGQLLVNSLNSR